MSSLLKNRPDSRRDTLPGEEACPFKAGSTHGSPPASVVKYGFQCMLNLACVLRIHQQSCVTNHLGERRCARGDDRRPASHRFERRQAESLHKAGKDDGRGSAIDAGQLRIRQEGKRPRAVGEGKFLKAGLDPAIRRSCQQQAQTETTQAAEGLEQAVDVLMRLEIADIEKVGEPWFKARTVRDERISDPISHIHDAIFRDRGPRQNLQAGVLGDREHAESTPAGWFHNRLVVNPLGGTRFTSESDRNQVMDGEDERASANWRRIEARRKERRRSPAFDLPAQPERVRERERLRAAFDSAVVGKSPEHLVGESTDAVIASPARIREEP